MTAAEILHQWNTMPTSGSSKSRSRAAASSLSILPEDASLPLNCSAGSMDMDLPSPLNQSSISVELGLSKDSLGLGVSQDSLGLGVSQDSMEVAELLLATSQGSLPLTETVEEAPDVSNLSLSSELREQLSEALQDEQAREPNT